MNGGTTPFIESVILGQRALRVILLHGVRAALAAQRRYALLARFWVSVVISCNAVKDFPLPSRRLRCLPSARYHDQCLIHDNGWPIMGPYMGPSWAQTWAQTWAQNGPRMGPKWTQDWPKTAPMWPQIAPRGQYLSQDHLKTVKTCQDTTIPRRHPKQAQDRQ